MIKSLSKLVSSFVKSGTKTLAQEDKATYDFFKSMTSGYTRNGKDLPRIVYEGANWNQLPKNIQKMAESLNLRRPNVVVRGRSAKEGQGILGFQIRDGERIVSNNAFALDITGGKPILQYRGNILHGEENVLWYDLMMNTTKRAGAAFDAEVKLNKELAQQIGIPEPVIENMTQIGKIPAQNVAEQTQYLRGLIANEGNIIHSIDECVPVLEQIAKRTGEVTVQSARESVELLLTKMGYDPKLLNLKILEKSPKEIPGIACFEANSGEMYLYIDQIKNYQDLADILSHEFTHMEDYLLAYKKLGPKKFKNLFVNDEINLDWYKEMSKYILPNQRFAFRYKNIPTEIIMEDGTKITDPKEIRKFLSAGGKAAKFNENTIEQELFNDIKMAEEYSSGQYARLKFGLNYYNSLMENHACESQRTLRSVLERKGNLLDTEVSRTDSYIHSIPELTASFEQVETALPSVNHMKPALFNRLYDKSAQVVDSDIALLNRMIRLAPEDNVVLQKLRDSLVQIRHGDYFYYDLKILNDMVRKLGLTPKVPFKPTPKQPYSIQVELLALERMNPEMAEIQGVMRKGLPKSEFFKLQKRLEELKVKQFGSEENYQKQLFSTMDKINNELDKRVQRVVA